MANDGRFQKGNLDGPRKPTLYTEALGDEICERLAKGHSLNAICKAEHMPAESTVRAWSIDLNHPLSAKYVRAREIAYYSMADELLVIADDGLNDKNVDDNGNVIIDHDHISRSRLRTDTRKWILSRMLPKIYGDKFTQEVKGADGAGIAIQIVTGVKRDGD